MNNAFAVEQLNAGLSTVPKDITGAAQTGVWFSLARGRNALVTFLQGAWAGGTAAVTFEQAQDAAAAGAKALVPAYAYKWSSTTSTGVKTKTAVTAGTFNLSVANTITQMEIQATDLDTANGFAYFRVNTATPGSNADLLAIMVQIYQLDQEGDPTTLPSVLT